MLHLFTGLVVGKLKEYLDKLISNAALSLLHLDKIEEKLAEHFEFPTFSAMKFGRFIHFLLAEAKPVSSLTLSPLQTT